MFEIIDDLLLGKAQKLCDKFQRLTGLTKFKLQKWALILHMVFMSGLLVTHHEGIVIAILCAMVVGVVACIFTFETEEIVFLRSGMLLDSSFGKPRLPILVLQSIVWLLNVLEPTASSPSILLGFPWLWAAMYFSACIPRPPSKSTVRKWYEKGLWWLNDKLQPAPIPVTNQ